MTRRVDAHAVILAGGTGTRFWPASRPDRPKQLLALGSGEGPLLRDTFDRAAATVGEERIRLVAPRELAGAIADVLPELPDSRLWLEPEPRGTGPALAWAAHRLHAADPGAVMVSMHADHVIVPLDALRETLARAADAARREGRLYCVGAPPDRPETGYGYLRLGEETAPGVHRVERFVEKPDPERARRYLESGGYLWNTGIFVWRVADFLDAVRRHTPEVAGALPALEEGDVEAFFRRVTPVTVDVGVLERADRVGAVRASFAWDDVGVWNALARTLPTDAARNVVVGRGRLVEAADNVVWAEDGPVTLFGVEGLVVVRSGGETLVTTREHAPRLKELLRHLDAEDGSGNG